MTALKLIFFEGCPNADRARKLLTQAGAVYEEIKQDLLPENHPLKGFASPTVLRGDEVIFGAKTGDGGGGCSLDIPMLNELKKRLGNEVQLSRIQRKSGVLSTVGSFASAATVGLCPVCIPAIGGFLSAIGLGVLVQESVLQPLLIAFLAITLFGLLWSFLKEHRKVGPLIVGVVMAVALYVSRYVYLGSTINSVLMYGSIVGIVAVSFWNIRLKKKMSCSSCVE